MKFNEHSWSDGAMAALIVKLLTCDNYLYIFCLKLIAWFLVQSLLYFYLFSAVDLFIYLPQNPYPNLFIYLVTAAYLFLFYLFTYRRVPISYLFIADRMEQHLEVTFTIVSGLSSWVLWTER